MKLAIIGIILAVIALVVIVAAGVNFLSSFSFSKLLPESQPPSSSPSPAPSPSPTPPPTQPPPTTPPTTTNAPAPTATQPAAEVNFEIAITNISGSGLSRTITADITNTGIKDAHDVWVKLEVFSQQTRVSLDGKDSLRVDVGTLPAKTSVTKQATLVFSITDGLKIMRNGADFTLTINSTERTQTMSQFYKP